MINNEEQYKKTIKEFVEKNNKQKSKTHYFFRGLIIVFGVLLFLSGLFIVSLYFIAL